MVSEIVAQRASFLPTVVQGYQFGYLRSRHTGAEIACWWSVFITFINKDHRSYTQQLQIFKSLRIRVVLAFCSGSVTFIVTFLNSFCLYSSIIHLCQFEYLRRCYTQTVLALWSVSVTHIDKEHIVSTQLSFIFTRSDI